MLRNDGDVIDVNLLDQVIEHSSIIGNKRVLWEFHVQAFEMFANYDQYLGFEAICACLKTHDVHWLCPPSCESDYVGSLFEEKQKFHKSPRVFRYK